MAPVRVVELPDSASNEGAGTTVTALLRTARQGDPDAWRQMHRRLDSLVVATARRHGLRPDECHDVSQTTWMRLVENVDRIRNDQALPGWLVTTATRESYAVSGRRRRELPVPELLVIDRTTTAGDPEAAVAARAYVTRVAHAINALPDRQRRLLQLLLLTADPPSYREISLQLGMPVGAIGPVRQRALRRLRDLLAERPPPADRPVPRQTPRRGPAAVGRPARTAAVGPRACAPGRAGGATADGG